MMVLCCPVVAVDLAQVELALVPGDLKGFFVGHDPGVVELQRRGLVAGHALLSVHEHVVEPVAPPRTRLLLPVEQENCLLLGLSISDDDESVHGNLLKAQHINGQPVLISASAPSARYSVWRTVRRSRQARRSASVMHFEFHSRLMRRLASFTRSAWV